MWVAEIEDSGNNSVPWPSGVTFTIGGYGERAQGGFDQATITATGPDEALWALLRWLGYRVRLRNPANDIVWAGIIGEGAVQLGALEVGLSLDKMYNRIAVAYTTPDAGGSSVRATTTWAEDAESIARYGIKELLYTLSDVSAAQAEATRNTLLATLSKPRAQLSLEGGEPGATLRCWGLIDTLGWRYYAQAAGLEEHQESSGEQVLGQGLTAATLGFTQDGRIHDTGNRLDALPKDSKVQVTGSAGNNGAHLLTGSGRDGEAYTAATISFETADDVLDSAAGFGFLSAQDILVITGSTSYSGTYRIKSAGGEHLTVAPDVGNEAAGPSITVTQAGSIRTSTVFTNELPGASVTLTTHGQKIAQSFSLGANTSWTVDQIAIQLRKVGTPVDGVKIELCADSAGAPGTVLASATVSASTLFVIATWIAFTMGNTATVSYGVTYWIVISRTGANAINDYYVVTVDDGLGYSRGLMKLWTGSSWVDRATNADLSFRVSGAWETTRQIQEIYSACNQYFAALDLVDASGISSLQYRDGDATALDELQALAAAGSSTGRRLLVTSTPERVLRVQLQAQSGENNLLLSSDGTVRTPTGRPFPKGKLPTSSWVRLVDVPGNVDALASLASIFIERAEYTDGRLRLEPQGAPSVWDIGAVVQG